MSVDMETRKKVKELSSGVLHTLVDSSLFVFALWAQCYSMGSGRKDIFRAIEDSVDFVKAVNKEYFKRGTYNAVKKGLLTKTTKGWELTGEGKKRLKEILPGYRADRPWKGKVYLITYDIPETNKRVRDILREYLKRMGCGMFQDSVWVTPYDPKLRLKDFIKDYQLSGLVVVSDIGKDGNIGQMSLRELVERVYKLDDLNERYKEFLEKLRTKKLSLSEINFRFYSILSNDPQLPFSLLPQGWLGDKAYLVFKRSFPS